jgi:putative SOS response-associated peptidase YedK
MCGRYYRTADKQAIAEYFHSAPAYNIAPTTTQPV